MTSTRVITLGERLRAEFPLKFILTLVLYPAVLGPYCFLQFHQFFTPTPVQPGFVDHWIPFDHRTVWIYLSLYLLTPIGPILMNTREQLLRYATGMLMVSVLAALVFIFHPTFCPRPNPTGINGLYHLVVLVDKPLHSFPSLHAAFALYSTLWAGQMFQGFRLRFGLTACAWIWAVLILYSTMATKQHMFIDIAAGSVLGTGIYFVVVRAPSPCARKISPTFPDPKPSPKTQTTA